MKVKNANTIFIRHYPQMVKYWKASRTADAVEASSIRGISLLIPCEFLFYFVCECTVYICSWSTASGGRQLHSCGKGSTPCRAACLRVPCTYETTDRTRETIISIINGGSASSRVVWPKWESIVAKNRSHAFTSTQQSFNQNGKSSITPEMEIYSTKGGGWMLHT